MTSPRAAVLRFAAVSRRDILAVVLLSLVGAFPALAAGPAATQRIRGRGILPVDARPAGITATAGNRRIVPIGQAPEGIALDRAVPGGAAERLGGRDLTFDPSARLEPLSASVVSSYGSQPQYYSVPYDAAIAASPTQLLVATNNQFGVYDKSTGSLLASGLHIHFFGLAAGGGFDPKVFWDPGAGRFVMVVFEVAENPDRALIDIAVSQTADAAGAWHKYTYDATLRGPDGTNTWADYPGLGFDDHHVYVTSDQYAFRDSFQFSRLRVFSKQELYAGTAASYVDFAPVHDADGVHGFTIKPARSLEPTPVGRLLATRPKGGTTIATWTVTGAYPDLQLSTVNVPVGPYAPFPDAVQAGSAEPIDAGDCRTQDVVWRAGRMHVAFTEKFRNDLAATTALRYLEISDGGESLEDVTYASRGLFLYYPAVSVDSAGNVAMVFGRSSSAEFASMHQTRKPAGGGFEPSELLVAGIAPNTSGRWGDYNAAATDPSDPSIVWLYGGYGNASNRWATWIASVRPSATGTVDVIELEDRPRADAGPIASLEVQSRPGTPGARIELSLARDAPVRLAVFDVTGRKVRELEDAALPAGRHTIAWDGTHEAGGRTAAGVCWVRAVSGGQSIARRVAVLR